MMFPPAAQSVDIKIKTSPKSVSIESPPKPLIAITPEKPSRQPRILSTLSLSLLKKIGAQSTVMNEAQDVIIEVFVPLVKPMPT